MNPALIKCPQKSENSSLSVVDVEPDLVEGVLPHGGHQELRLGGRGGDGVTLTNERRVLGVLANERRVLRVLAMRGDTVPVGRAHQVKSD